MLLSADVVSQNHLNQLSGNQNNWCNQGCGSCLISARETLTLLHPSCGLPYACLPELKSCQEISLLGTIYCAILFSDKHINIDFDVEFGGNQGSLPPPSRHSKLHHWSSLFILLEGSHILLKTKFPNFSMIYPWWILKFPSASGIYFVLLPS